MSEDFNAEQFMNTEVTGEMNTEYVPIPEGEYRAVIKEVSARTTPNGSPLLEVIWIIDDQEVRDLIGMDEPTARQTVWLDINEQTNGLDFGANKNVMLGRLREALGQNDGQPWSPTRMMGQVATVNLKHRITDQGATFVDVKGVRA